MSLTTILTTDADVTGGTFSFPLYRQQALCQISITGTQTVALQGRIDSTHSWFTIKTVTASDAFLFTRMPEIRAVSSATSGGSCVVSVAS